MRKADRQRVVNGIETLVQLQQEILAAVTREPAPAEADASDPELSCALCGRSRGEVPQIIKGKQGAVCGECVERASDVLAGIRAGTS
jgi:ClpX C4-type zinc finger